MVRLWIVGTLLLSPPAAVAQECDTATEDCDGDGFAPPEDCDEADAEVNPDADELCMDGIDDDCDGEADDGCDDRFRDGELSGGSSCSDDAGGWAALWLLPLVARRRR